VEAGDEIVKTSDRIGGRSGIGWRNHSAVD
jgi:hypothetical protein